MDPFDLALILAYIFLIEAWYYPKLVVMKWRYATTTKTPVKFSKAENKCKYFLFSTVKIILKF